MTWVKFPLTGGAVNNRPANNLAPGELAEASGVAYSPNSDQLKNDLQYSEWYYRPDNFGTYTGYRGPFYMSFENSDDWICLVCNQTPPVLDPFTDRWVRGRILFARADGSAQWVLSSLTLSDNNVNRTNGISAAKMTQWGDRYYLATDQGMVVIEPPTGTGAPIARRLGELAPEPRIGNIEVANDPGKDSGFISYLTGTSTQNNIATGDAYTLVITEYNSETGVESAPVYLTGSTASGWFNSTWETPYRIATADYEYARVSFPTEFWGSGDLFRAYIMYHGAVPGDISYNDLNNKMRTIWQDGGATVGANLLNVDGATEWTPGQTVSFSTFRKDLAQNPLPVLAVDNARIVYRAQRHPSCSTVAVVWNDSLITNDSGFRNEESTVTTEFQSVIGVPYTDEYWGYRGEDPIPSILRYSPPGEPHNQPAPYFMNFASEREDAIKGLSVVNDRLLVLCDQAVHTVRYLPFNNLLAAQQGRVKDVVTTNVGLAGPDAHAKVETPRGEMAVWLSRRGLEWSDGTGWDDACPDFSVPANITAEDLDEAILVAVPSEYRLDLYLEKTLYSFYYHASHLKNGRLKMLGPTDIGKRVFGACEYRGVVYRFDGVDIETTDNNLRGGSGRVYTGHITGENPFKDVVIEDLGLTHGPVSGRIDLRCDSAVEGSPLETGTTISLQNPQLDQTSSGGIARRGNYVRFNLAVDGTEDWAVGPMWIQGDEDSGGRG